ncbi:MAG: hypothetical protein AAF533_07165 [Acidobacteriota bacterium]
MNVWSSRVFSRTPARVVPVVFLSLALAGSTSAETPTECLRESFKLKAKNPERSLQVLRECADRFPDSVLVQLSLGRRLLKTYENTGDPGLRPSIISAFERAIALDEAQVSEEWMDLSHVYQDEKRPGESLNALEKGMAFLPGTERRGLYSRCLDLALAADDGPAVLRYWEKVRYDLEDDADLHLQVGQVARREGDRKVARSCFARVLELRPGDPVAAAEACRAYISEADDLLGSGRRKMLAACRAVEGQLARHELDTLLAAAEASFMEDEARRLRLVMQGRGQTSGRSELILAEESLRSAMRSNDDRQQRDAIRRGRQALRMGGPSQERGSVEALIGRLMLKRARARYERAPSNASDDFLSRSRSDFQAARGHLRQARRLGQSVDRELNEVDRILSQLSGMGQALGQAEVDARRATCHQLGSDARRQYGVGSPMTGTMNRDVQLATRAGDSGSLGRLSSGDRVELLDAKWVPESCWVRLKGPQGDRGWAPSSSVDQ